MMPGVRHGAGILKYFYKKTWNVPLMSSGSGFTLLELTVSFVVIGIIALIIAGSMRAGFNIVDKGEERIDSLERIRTSINIINSQVQSQFPLIFEEDGEERFYFLGEGGEMRFASNYSIWGGRTGYVTVTYKVEEAEAGKVILRISENTVGMDNTRETVLFTSLDAFSFEYFYKDPLEEEGAWVDIWTDGLHLPEKVRLQIMYDTKDISMVIPMRTTVSLTEGSSGGQGSGPWMDIKKAGAL
jgi:hypothetical protein